MFGQTVAVDFDGVIHAYSRGWHDGTIYDEPVSGAIEGIKRLQQRYAVYVFTSREPLEVASWLAQWFHTVVDPEHAIGGSEQAEGGRVEFWNDREAILVTNRKLPAVAYVDDRAVRFTTWQDLDGQLRVALAT